MTRRAAVFVVGLVAAALVGVALLAIPGSPLEQRPTLGLDLQGGLEVTLQAVPPKDRKLTKEDLDRSVSIMRSRVDKLGASLRTVETFDDFECRGRNRVVGAKLSEHGKGNAVDVRSFVLADGRSIGLTDISVAKDFRDGIRDSACHRFTTVLGPGADAQHESHIHLDLIERTQGYRMCQWDVREPAKTEVAAQVPLPPPRPAVPVAR